MDRESKQEENQGFRVDSKLLVKHIDELNDAFRVYFDEINPRIIEFQSIEGTFPIGVLNEIRAIYGHLVRAASTEDENEVAHNIEKIKGHTKRALLDCYKYSTLQYLEYYTTFMKRYQNVDLTYIDHGKFLADVTELHEAAMNQFQDANQSDLNKEDEDEQFSKYELAYQSGHQLHDMLRAKEKDAAYLKRKATRKDIISVLSLIVGIAGIIIAIIK